MKKPLPLALIALALAGCINVGGRSAAPPVVYHVLEDARAADRPATAQVPAHAPTLLVLDTASSGFYDGDPLVFSRTVGTRGQYQFARWTERPGKRFADLMRERLDGLGAYRVSAAGSYLRGDLLLDSELVEFYHDASHAPGQVRLVLRAELLDMKSRRLLGRRVFERQAPAPSYDAEGAARASAVAVGQVLDELAAWLASFPQTAYNPEVNPPR